MYKIELKPKAQKFIEKQPQKIQKQLIGQIEKLQDNPRPQNCIELDSQRQIYRLKCGEYRIIYQIQDKHLLVLIALADYRKDIERIYKNLKTFIKNFPKNN